MILKEMVRSCELPINKMLDWYGNQSDILIHNYDVFMTNKHLENSTEQFLKAWKNINGI